MDRRIRNEDDLSSALAALLEADPRLGPAAASVGALPLRLHAPGLAGLLRIIVGQQLSVASAKAVWQKVETELGGPSAEAIRAADDAAMRRAGLSRQKARTFRAVAEAVDDGLDLDGLCDGPAEIVRGRLTEIGGVGPWTADIYLMFCAGHPDILPVGDLAVRRGAQRCLALEAEPDPKALGEMGVLWAPYRSTAARLFWAYYAHARSAAAASPRPRADADRTMVPI